MMMWNNRWLYFYFVAFVSCIDTVLTAGRFVMYGPSFELNPLMRAVLIYSGVSGFVELKLFTVFLAALIWTRLPLMIVYMLSAIELLLLIHWSIVCLY